MHTDVVKSGNGSGYWFNIAAIQLKSRKLKVLKKQWLYSFCRNQISHDGIPSLMRQLSISNCVSTLLVICYSQTQTTGCDIVILHISVKLFWNAISTVFIFIDACILFYSHFGAPFRLQYHPSVEHYTMILTYSLSYNCVQTIETIELGLVNDGGPTFISVELVGLFIVF